LAGQAAESIAFHRRLSPTDARPAAGETMHHRKLQHVIIDTLRHMVDGTNIAIAYATTDRTRGLYLMNADGSHLRRLTRAAGQTDTGPGRPAWRPRP
jgi:hypothetical protein